MSAKSFPKQWITESERQVQARASAVVSRGAVAYFVGTIVFCILLQSSINCDLTIFVLVWLVHGVDADSTSTWVAVMVVLSLYAVAGAMALVATAFAPSWLNHPPTAWQRIGWTPLLLIFLTWLGVALRHARLAWRVARAARRRQRGECGTCGYDLTGNTTGLCPECAEPIFHPEPVIPAPATGGTR